MNRLLLIFVGLMCWTSVSFGQHSFEVPLSLNFIGTTPAFLSNSVFDFKKGTLNVNNEPVTVETYKLISSFKPELGSIPDVPEIGFSDGSNMPSIDLSKGYMSNFIVKEFSKDFPSQMPITELLSPNLIVQPQLYK